jgi:hypothetical protein
VQKKLLEPMILPKRDKGLRRISVGSWNSKAHLIQGKKRELTTLVPQRKREGSLSNMARLMLELRMALMTPLVGSLGHTHLTLGEKTALTLLVLLRSMEGSWDNKAHLIQGQKKELTTLVRQTKREGSLDNTHLTVGQRRVLTLPVLLRSMEGNWDKKAHLTLDLTMVPTMQQEPKRLHQRTKLTGNLGNTRLIPGLKRALRLQVLRTNTEGSWNSTVHLILDPTRVPMMQQQELMRLHQRTKLTGNLDNTRLTPGPKRVLR